MKIILKGVTKRFRTRQGVVEALHDVDLEIRDREFFVLLGPSGCGKSTLLNLVAGLEAPSAGEIRFDATPVAAPSQKIFVPPRSRNVAMVFQSYALYPHLDVFHNIAFPLQVARWPAKEIRQAVAKTSALLGIDDLLNRKPRELSGGQRQRVAMARALVRRPRVFLLDEPLSNLDAQLRTGTRTRLKELQRELGITTLYVTHDQTEAMTLGGRIALLKDGRLLQVDTPAEMYKTPRTPFAATFIGSPPMNLIPARIESHDGRLCLRIGDDRLWFSPRLQKRADHLRDKEVLAGIRPEHVEISRNRGDAALAGAIFAIEPLGRENLLHVRGKGFEIIVLNSDNGYNTGDTVFLTPLQERLHIFENNT